MITGCHILIFLHTPVILYDQLEYLQPLQVVKDSQYTTQVSYWTCALCIRTNAICNLYIQCTIYIYKLKLKLNATFDPQRCQKHHASHYGAHLATYDQVAQYSTCACGSDPLLLALVVFFHSQLAYLLYCHMWWSYCYLRWWSFSTPI